MSPTLRPLAAALLLVFPVSMMAQISCPFAWDPAFGNPGATGPMASGYLLVNKMLSWNNGTGPGLYATGSFTSMGGVPANGIARWTGVSWSALGSGLGAAGRTMAIYDDGSGPALFAGGSFSTAGGVTVNGIAKWDGSTWSAVGGGMNAVVEDLIVFDDGTGPALYAAGWFTQAGGGPASLVARWNGTAWAAVGGGLGGPAGSFARCFAVHTDGNGTMLYVGGALTFPAPNVCRLQGGTWTGFSGITPNWVGSLLTFDDGTGSALFAGSMTGNGVWRWAGNAWSLAGGSAVVSDFTVFDAGSGPRLHASGVYGTIQSWDGSNWTSISAPIPGNIYGLMTHDDGTGPALHVGGSFSSTGIGTAGRIARWRRPVPALLCYQPGGAGTGVWLANYGLVPGNTYQNVVSDVLCLGGPNTGPWLGLCAGDPNFLFFQIALPLGAAPFHYQATALTSSFGPFGLAPGFTFEIVCFDRTGNVLGCSGPAIRYTVQ